VSNYASGSHLPATVGVDTVVEMRIRRLTAVISLYKLV